ncbi:IS110 family transposase [Edwardsiella ictaluri]|nr:IS110 family transposase [Edwardsiella ictaluri]BEI08492.1 IS110 family transposase [Edwardsiella ictaluri]BEI15450.1 IS110 family transposase [Edwardsiella ictaluri]
MNCLKNTALSYSVFEAWNGLMRNIIYIHMGFINGMVAPYILCHSGTINRHYLSGAAIMSVKTIGIDLAKEVFQIHGTDEHGKRLFNKQLKRAKMLSFFANIPPCLIGMEACASAHFWAGKLISMGHNVKLMAPQFVKPYVKTNKHDAADAEAICEAVTRPNMRFVPVKTPEQQAVLALHRSRQSFIKQRTAQANQIRGLLAEFGIVVSRGIQQLQLQLPEILEDANNSLPSLFRVQLSLLQHHMTYLFDVIATLDKQIEQCYRQNALCQRISKIPGIGPVTATALIATIGNASNFENSRQLAAWLGLVPRQHSSGGKQVLLGISKRGDVYLRTLLIHGARAVLQSVKRKQDAVSGWASRLLARRNNNIASVALANKNARIVWALLSKDQEYCAAVINV